ncbi:MULTISPECIES: hypothetical protein [unclassified Chelatococcus]|uniref:hypothetical protein n=1 Tax=unclassified Chelatococcus TaxID=2638111 RepID=UPI001BCB99D2|nr:MULTISPECIES: hypothetical protein [unclassified Chelatococcus]MBS7696200.1 hypothetical protein [Chelatococcus sp. YT9]MBX3557773.1 hypothetical protein [Chelatococcus sp.]
MPDSSALAGRRDHGWNCVCGGVVVLALIATTPTVAQTTDVEKAATAYVTANGFVAHDPGAVMASLDSLFGPDEGMTRQDTDVSAVEKSLLLLEAQEPPLGRVRYMLRYGEVELGETTLSVVDVRRYNLGPAIREETIEAYGAGNTAEPETFGVGPHVGWRIAFQPGSKAAAMVVAAGRREIPDAEAAGDDCRARRCLDLDLLDNHAEWVQLAEPVREPSTGYPAVSPTPFGDEQVEDQTPAYVALQLAMAAGIANEDGDGGLPWDVEQRQGPATDEPLFVVVIDRNLGQETMTDAALGIPKLGKESEERWVRRFGDVSYQTYQISNGPLRRRIE